ncbi:MAG: PilZ domain-containing protein [Actinobacteria bacterium]|nr:PilZ domain-containing protein [Actinomycetota bacterium]
MPFEKRKNPRIPASDRTIATIESEQVRLAVLDLSADGAKVMVQDGTALFAAESAILYLATGQGGGNENLGILQIRSEVRWVQGALAGLHFLQGNESLPIEIEARAELCPT